MILLLSQNAALVDEIRRKLNASGPTALYPVAQSSDAMAWLCQQQPALVMIDIAFIGPADAITIANLIRADFSIPMLLLTTSAENEQRVNASPGEPFACLEMPCTARELRLTFELVRSQQNTEQTVQMRELEARHRLTNLIINNLGQGLTVTNADGCFDFVNPA